MKTVFGCALIAVLAAGTAAASETGAAEQAHKIKRGSKIEAVLLTGEKLDGRLGSVTDSTFELMPRDTGTAAARTVSFTDVKKLTAKKGHMVRNILITVGVAFFVLVEYAGTHT
jgi:hypothetical protein